MCDIEIKPLKTENGIFMKATSLRLFSMLLMNSLSSNIGLDDKS